MSSESHRKPANAYDEWTVNLTDQIPRVTDGYDPTPREVPFPVEAPRHPGQVRVPLGHIVNMGDFEGQPQQER